MLTCITAINNGAFRNWILYVEWLSKGALFVKQVGIFQKENWVKHYFTDCLFTYFDIITTIVFITIMFVTNVAFLFYWFHYYNYYN